MRKFNRLKVVKRILAGWMVLLLLTAFYPGGAQATEKPSVTLEQAIRIVKDNFPVPAEYKEFSSGFSSYHDYQVWSLDWKTVEEPGGSFHAAVDAVTGEILSMSTWKPDYRPEPVPQKPAVSVAQARQTAVELLNRLAASRLGELQLVPNDSQPIPLSSYGGVVYSFRWQRMVNGIPFPDNGVTIGVSGDDGKVNSYFLNWHKGDLPAAAGVIGGEQAQQVFKDKKMLELQYFLTPIYGPLSTPEKQRVMLVYRLNHPSQGVIDAFSGEPIELDELFGGSGEGDSAVLPEMAGKNLSTPADYKPLTPEEQREVEKTAKVISQEQAIAEVKRWVTVPSSLALSNVQMVTDWQSPEIRFWSLYWSDEKAKPGQLSSLSAQVNAFTGELLSFYCYYQDQGSPQTGSIDREAARKLAEDLLRRLQPQRFKEVELDQNFRSWPVPFLEKGQNPPSQQFSYRRLVNGVPFPANGITVTVDTVNRRITSYHLNWKDYQFPSPEGIITWDLANANFLQEQPLTLLYSQIYESGGKNETRLVYRPHPASGQPSSQLIDAKTGEQLDWQGRPLSQQPRARQFSDISGSFAETEISFLGQAGLFGEYGEVFRPEEKISAASMLRAMLMIKQGVWENSELTDEEIMRRARQMGWLKEDLQPDHSISRETAAKLLIRLLNLERAARVEGIYKLPYRDAPSISRDAVGHVALAWGLGIMKGSKDQLFHPDLPLSRAEAAVALVRTLEVRP